MTWAGDRRLSVQHPTKPFLPTLQPTPIAIHHPDNTQLDQDNPAYPVSVLYHHLAGGFVPERSSTRLWHYAGRDIAEIAVVGFDDIPVGSLISPALTTVQQPLHEMAEAVVRLTQGGAGVGEPRPSLVFPPTLVVRASTERRIV